MHQSEFSIYYEDTDLSGFVYHANYLKFCERGRTNFLRENGFKLSVLLEQGIQFVVSAVDVKYHKPASLNDCIMVNTQIKKLAGARITFEQSIVRTEDEAVLCEADIIVGCLDLNFKPTRIPEKMKKELL